MPPSWLLRQKWDGIINRPTNAALARVFRRMRIPVMDLNDLHADLGFPRLQSDNHAIGRLAAQHLRERGFTSYGYCGFLTESWASQLLRETDWPLKRIAAECGFLRLEYLSYLFAKTFGESPGRFRRSRMV